MGNEPKPVKKQTMRYSDAEMSLMKNTFAENDELLFALRKVFLQMPLDVIDKDILNAVTSKPAVLALIRKSWLPTLDPKAPIHQLIDLWMTLEIKDKSFEEAWQNMTARRTLIAYLEQQLQVLENNLDTKLIKINFADLSNMDSTKDQFVAFTNLLARNAMIGHTEMQVSQFLMLAGKKDESVDQTATRLRNSSK